MEPIKVGEDINEYLLSIDLCASCGIDERYYMVNHNLWEEFGNGKGRLCIKCFEKRLGRELNKKDFIYCAVDYKTKLIQ